VFFPSGYFLVFHLQHEYLSWLVVQYIRDKYLLVVRVSEDGMRLVLVTGWARRGVEECGHKDTTRIEGIFFCHFFISSPTPDPRPPTYTTQKASAIDACVS